MALPHTGSWGLPDFGITELFTQNRTDQGGSNLPFFGQQATPSSASTGQVAGASTGLPYIYPQPDYSYTPPKTNTGGSSGGGSAPAPTGFNPKDPNANPGQGWFWDAADGWKSTSGGGLSSEAQAEAERLRNTINSGWDSYTGNLGNLEGYYGNQMNNALGSVGNTYNSIYQGLDSSLQNAYSKLAGNRTQIGQRVGESAQDLAGNLRSMVRNTGMQLGAMGAGDTSASNIMAPYAYTKLAGTEYGKIQRQGNEQLFEVDQAENDTRNQFTQMKLQADMEKEGQLQQVRDQYGQIISQIKQQMASAPLERSQALAALSTQILQEAQNRLANLESFHLQRQASLQDWATQRMAQLNDYKLQLNKSSNFNPRDIAFNELQSGQFGAYGGSQDQYLNPMSLAQKKRQSLGL